MQMVEAKCIMPAWDSINCVQYIPGQGPLPGGLYKIDRESDLAKLKTAGGAKGKYVFDFDRNAGPDDKPHDYSCKKEGCGEKFKTLAALGSHTRSAHRDDDEVDEEPVVVAKDARGKNKGKTFKCKVCSEVFPNLYAITQHNKTHVAKPSAEAAVTETA